MHITILTVVLLALGVLAVLALCGMALTTEPNLRQTSSAYNNLAHEDLMDKVDRVNPADTPAYSMARREYELGNTEFSWEVDSWPAILGAQGPGDGYDVQDAEIRDVTANKRKMGNYGQAFRRAFGAGWIANQVPNLPGVGRGNLVANGAADAMILLKQDIEAGMCSFDQTATPDVGSASGSVMAGIRKLVDPANAYAAASAFAYGKPTDLHSAPTGAILTGALASVFNWSAIKTIVKALRVATKAHRTYEFLCGLDLREAVSGLIEPSTTSATGGALAATQARIFTQNLADNELGISIDVIRTDYGTLRVIPTDIIGTTTTNAAGAAQNDANRANRVHVAKPKYGLVLPREKLFKRWGVPFQPVDIATSGGGTKKAVRGYVTLGVGNPTGFGVLELT